LPSTLSSHGKKHEEMFDPQVGRNRNIQYIYPIAFNRDEESTTKGCEYEKFNNLFCADK
jgi:hypothetical protein